MCSWNKNNEKKLMFQGEECLQAEVQTICHAQQTLVLSTSLPHLIITTCTKGYMVSVRLLLKLCCIFSLQSCNIFVFSLSSFYQELLMNGIFKPLEGTTEGMMAMEEGTVHYVTPSGMSSVVKHYLKESG